MTRALEETIGGGGGREKEEEEEEEEEGGGNAGADETTLAGLGADETTAASAAADETTEAQWQYQPTRIESGSRSSPLRIACGGMTSVTSPPREGEGNVARAAFPRATRYDRKEGKLFLRPASEGKGRTPTVIQRTEDWEGRGPVAERTSFETRGSWRVFTRGDSLLYDEMVTSKGKLTKRGSRNHEDEVWEPA